jgi:hypothetical protein
LVHDDFAKVFHYHHQTFGYRFRRLLTIYSHQYRYFGCCQRPAPFWYRLGQFTWHLARWRELPFDRRLYWMGYNLRLLLAEWTATSAVRAALRIGGRRALDRLHDVFCTRAPQATVQCQPGASGQASAKEEVAP